MMSKSKKRTGKPPAAQSLPADFRRAVEDLLVRASMERDCKLHWGKIYANAEEYVDDAQVADIRKLAFQWGVDLIGW